ncbi:MAG: xanthine dehydrogenase small subunit, partial [Gammaproteobacteria bacterium]|nr:xanthine dehydrogenase small subunit [Gammaproteobacteria bacterium]
SLNPHGEDLHPVQKALVDCHGSQCGFCTPGFVMSLFALYKTNPQPTRVEIDDALAGNLCRCTGYRPIIAAAEAMYGAEPDAQEWLRQAAGGAARPERRVRRLRQLARSGGLTVGGKDRSFHAPSCSDELAQLLAEHPEATLLAGGTDVGLWVTKQQRQLRTIIYTGRVTELRKLETTRTHIEIGAAVTLSDAMQAIVAHYPDLGELWRRFASPPIRNAGTLGGNIANGSPIGDSMPSLIVAGATLVLRSRAGTRETALEDFYIDYQVNDLRPGEFIETVRLPLPGRNTILRCHKLSKRFDQDISAVCSAYRLQLDGEQVKSFRMACGGLAATVKRARCCEQAIVGQRWDAATVEGAAAALAKDFKPITDMRASAGYRLHATQNLLRRLLLETQGELEQTVYSYGRQG